MSDNRLVKLTDVQRSILMLAQSEGAIHAGSIVDANLVRGRNKRTAKSCLARLHSKLGLLDPIRTCEYKLSAAGQAWLDIHVRPLGGEP